jgi:hypothetical protein
MAAMNGLNQCSATAVADRRTVAPVLVAALVIVAAALLRPGAPQPPATPVIPTASARAAAATQSPTATATVSPDLGMRVLSPGRQVDPMAPTARGTPSLTAAQQLVVAGPRNWRAGLTPTTQPAHLPPPQVAGVAVGVAQVPGIIIDPAPINFDGLGVPAGAAAPGQGLCASATREIQLVDPAAAFFDSSGAAAAAPVSLNAFFGEPGSFTDSSHHQIVTIVTQPHCYYDAPTQTWFAAALVLGLDLTTAALYANAHLDLALNRAGDPRTPWTVYAIDVADDGSDGTPRDLGCPCLGDQPLLGVDVGAVYLTTNEFTLAGAFTGGRIYALDKAALLAGTSPVNMALYHRLAIGGVPAASIQPATQVGDPGAEFFMSALDPAGGTDNRLAVWAMTNEAALAHGAPPTLTAALLGAETYGRPPTAGAAQRGTAVRLDAGDDRLQQVEFRNGQLYTALATAILPHGDNMPRTGVAWFDVTPHLGSGGALGASIVAQGYIAVQGASLLAPDLGVAWDGDMAVVATLVGAGSYPTAVYTTTHPRGFSPFGPLQIARMGTQPYAPPECENQAAASACAWAEFSTTAWDPTNLDGEAVMWMTTAYAPQAAAANGGYGTRIFAVGPI